jgi:cell envelope opacity-associated protein A
MSADIGGIKLAYASEGAPPDPYAGFEARIVPENMTLFAKTKTDTTGGNSWNERVVSAKKGDTVASVLRELGAAADDIKSIVTVLGQRVRDTNLRDGQKVRVLLGTPSGQGRPDPHHHRQ